MAIFISLTRKDPPTVQVLVNVDQVILVQPKQDGGTSILFGKDHVISFSEDYETVNRRLGFGPFTRTD